MDKKVYEKTRYQNIYRHKKNKNYVIMMSKPVKTSISRIGDKKIMRIEDAIDIRDNKVLKGQKAAETLHKESFEELWFKYMSWCKNIQKQAYNTCIKKDKLYNKFFKGKIDRPVTKITTDYICDFIDNCDTTDKQKNHIIKELKIFFNWCLDETRKYINKNPLYKVPNYKVPKPIMKYWTPEQLKKFLDCVHEDIINSKNLIIKAKAYLVYTFTVVTFILGDRVGESRALAFNTADKSKKILPILHSINYDPKSNDFVCNTKTYESEREIDVTDKLIDTIEDYKKFLIIEMGYEVEECDLIFFNFKKKRPYCDGTIRKHFNYYIKKSGVPHIRMYDLRHTYAATMMSEGREAYLFSQRMGHKNIQTTINVYGHLSNDIRKEIATVTDKYI